MVAAYLDAVRTTAEDTINSNGGKVFTAGNMERLRRFLILGTQNGSYYVNERELTLQNVEIVKQCLDESPMQAINEIVSISVEGRAPKQDPALLALAMASVHPNERTRSYANASITQVCRTGTHLLHFVKYRRALGGRGGASFRKNVNRWFLEKTPRDLAYQAVKYPSRDGWALADLLRLCRPKPNDTARNAIFDYIVDGNEAITSGLFDGSAGSDWWDFLASVTGIQSKNVPLGLTCKLIEDQRIPREALPTEFLNEPKVWEALLKDMPMTAMLRNLGKMTSVGILDLGSWGEGQIVYALSNMERIRKARVHPIAILAALKVYEQGHGIKGSLTWMPNKRIVNALDESFYTAFAAITPSNQRMRLAVDVSGSMVANKIAGMEYLDARTGAAAMSLVTMATEPNADVVAYSHTMVPLNISPNMRLDQVMSVMDHLPFGQTNCALPILDAIQKNERDIDAFVSYTDSETGGYFQAVGLGYIRGYGTMTDALREYRNRSGKPTASVVVGMTSNGFTLADPKDTRSLDVVGFDTAAPAVISDFIAGRI